MKNLTRIGFASVLLMGIFSSLTAEDVWPPVRPWTDPWGDARMSIELSNDTIASLQDKDVNI